MAKPAYKRTKIKFRTLIIMMIAISVLSAIVLQTSYRMESKKMALIQRELELENAIEEQERYAVELEEFKKYTKTKKYAEEVAKEKLGLVYSDEIVFRPEE